MKVIHLISGGDSGGAKTHVLSLLQNLNKTITAQLVCFRDGPFAEEARAMGIPTMICGGNNIPHLRRELAAYIRQGGYQLIHCHGSRANMIGALLRKPTGLPVVSTVHSDYKLDYMGRPFARLTFGAINAWALRHLDYRIGVSDAMVDLLIDRGFPPDRFYAIYNGIDFTPAPSQGDRLAYLRGLGADVEENSVVVGIAARLNPVKDMSTLIRGFAEGHKSCPRLRLVIAGDGEERQKLEDLAKELGVEKEVTFAGWISGGMDRFYSALDVNALTSLSETFPYALTEGARFHLATVATAVGGIPYLIDQDVNGYLFTPGDWQTLGRYLAALGNGDALRREMGEKLYEKASAKFSIQSTVDTQLHIYEEIIRRHNRPKRDRDGVVICGAYGRGNAGDDAILEAILQEMRSIDPDMPITVLTKDPKATRLKEITFDEMLELASLGAQVLNNRSVELAKKYGVELEVLSSINPVPGTVVKEETKVEGMLIKGVAKDEDVAVVSILEVPDVPGMSFKVFSLLAQKNINVDIILQSSGSAGCKDVIFTCSKGEAETARAVLESNKTRFGTDKITVNNDCAKVSIVGAGMQSHPGTASTMFEALYSQNINIHMISTSEIKISVIIDKADADRAVAAIHDAFIQ